MLRKPLALSLAAISFGALAFAATRLAQEPALPQPTEHHQWIVDGAGEWEGTLTSFLPGMPTAPTPAKESVVAIGGFWTQSRFTCDFMGMPYVGVGVLGYDVEKKKFVSTWSDSMSSFLALMEGDMDPKTKTLVMRWTAPDMTGKPAQHRSETVHEGDSYTSTFFVGEGAGTKSMVIAMARKGAKPAKASAPQTPK